jgi:large subunit ribosomal protein L6
MSRIGNNPVRIPEGVTVDIQGQEITVKGKLGELKQYFDAVEIKVEDANVYVTRPSDSKEHKAKHGLYRSLVNNMLKGVSEGWTKQLELVGVGYRANANGQLLELSLGYSHDIVMQIPAEVSLKTETLKGKNPVITLESIDNELIGQVAAKIRSLRKPEPYKGKGIRFLGEEIRRKAGKSAAKK